jgi:hypothetical protein
VLLTISLLDLFGQWGLNESWVALWLNNVAIITSRWSNLFDSYESVPLLSPLLPPSLASSLIERNLFSLILEFLKPPSYWSPPLDFSSVGGEDVVSNTSLNYGHPCYSVWAPLLRPLVSPLTRVKALSWEGMSLRLWVRVRGSHRNSS